jgi:hypothetical protein
MPVIALQKLPEAFGAKQKPTFTEPADVDPQFLRSDDRHS